MTLLDSSLESLGRRFPLTTSQVCIAGRTYEISRPQSADDLISEEEFNVDERLPYWAEIWPSSRVLAERVGREAGNGRRLLELGCGVGLVSLAAAQAGFDVLASDYYVPAVEFTALNARQNNFSGVDSRMLDWRSFPDDLGLFDVVAASDVLYERANAALVAGILALTLAPRGLALVTDPGRQIAQSFAEQCRERGLQIVSSSKTPVVEGNTRLHIDLLEIRRQ